FGTIEMFGPVLAQLAEQRKVIAVDLYGHGRTALTDRKIEPAAMADDMAMIVRALGFEQVDALGVSSGGSGPAGFGLGPIRLRRLLCGYPRAAERDYPRRRGHADENAFVRCLQG